MALRIIEQPSTFTPLGLRFWDPAFACPVEDGMTAIALPWGQPRARAVTAVRSFSGALAFHGLPGLRAVENAGPAAAASTRRFLVEISDIKRRYAPAAFAVDLPLPYRGPYLGPVLPSPAPPGFLLLSGPDRPQMPGLAQVSGTLALAATGLPCAWAVVTATDPEGGEWHGLSGPDGRFRLLLPWPALAEVPPASPPISGGSALSRQSWTLEITVQADPGGLPPLAGSALPDYAAVLAQPQIELWPEAPGASPGLPATATLSVRLDFGAAPILRSLGDSRLLLGPPPAISSP